MSATIPTLERSCNSWIVTSPKGVIRELYDPKLAEIALAHNWRVETALQYLCRINGEIRS